MTRRKNDRGVITVLISLLLVGVLSLGTLAIEAGRYQAAKTQLAEANISAATSMIAAYDSDLYARYGLLAIDTERFTIERAADYLNFNADQVVGYRGNRLATLYVTDSVELTGVYNLTYPNLLKRQLLTRAKYRIAPQDHALNLYTADAFFEDFLNKCNMVVYRLGLVTNIYIPNGEVADVPQDMYAALQLMREACTAVERSDSACNTILSSNTVSKLPSITGTVDNNAPSEDLTDISIALSSATSILGGSAADLAYSVGTATAETDVVVNVPDMADVQRRAERILFEGADPSDIKTVANDIRELAIALRAALKMMREDKETNILLNSYIAQYFSNRHNTIENGFAPQKGNGMSGVDNANFVSACVEYILGGSADEQQNQEMAYSLVQAIRLINNIDTIMNSFDYSVMFTSRCKVSALLVWAFYETAMDMELMIRHGVSVPLNKKGMILPISNPVAVVGAFAEKNIATALTALGYYSNEEGNFVIKGAYPFSYRDSLAFALWFAPNSKKILRVADLIQLEMRYHQQYVEHKTATFLMSDQNTYCRIKCAGKFVPALPVLSTGSDGSMKGLTFQSIKYAGY